MFTLRLDPAVGRFDDGDLVEFLGNREALAVHEHFFTHDQLPTWALLVSYRNLPRDAGKGPAGRSERGRKDWWAELAEHERPLFDALRRWRGTRSQRDGKPPYLLLTNRQVFDIVRARPETLAALTEVKGIGAGKAGDFGEEVLELLRQVSEADGDAGGDGDGDGDGGASVAGAPGAADPPAKAEQPDQSDGGEPGVR